jgi:hypothetical protein
MRDVAMARASQGELARAGERQARVARYVQSDSVVTFTCPDVCRFTATPHQDTALERIAQLAEGGRRGAGAGARRGRVARGRSTTVNAATTSG